MMNIIDISREVVIKMFPSESWTEEYKNVFVASSRVPKNNEQQKVFEKELEMAKIASDNNHTVYLLPELSTTKNPDAIMDGVATEFKAVTGGENAVSHRFRDGLHQGHNVYIKIDSPISAKRVQQILHGGMKDKSNNGLVYCYIAASKIMYHWKMDDLK